MSATPPTVSNGVASDSPRTAGGFTAANRSPSSSSDQAVDGAGSNTGQSDGQKSDSDSASGKRKHPEAHANGETQKRPRVLPAANGDASTRAYEAANGQANGVAHAPSTWPEHQRNGSSTSDAALAEVLTSNMSVANGAVAPTGPDTYQQHTMQNEFPANGDGKYQLAPGVTAQQLQRGAGQRKRNFSNRTKTGCLTCRERKKKCDERKPACANCERGGFLCKGYASNGNYKSNGPSQLPLQPSQNPYPQQYYQPHNAIPDYYPQAPPVAPPHGQDPHARPQAYANPQWTTGPPQPTHFQPDSSHRPEYQNIAAHPAPIVATQQPIPQMPDVARHQHHQQHPQKMPPPEPVHPPHNRSNSSHAGFTPYGNHAGPKGQSYTAYNNQRTAQLALEHSSREPATEKGKMLAGFPFNPRDPDLKAERYECAQRVYRFNKNAGEPGLLSDSSRRDQLRQILEPAKTSASPSNRKSASPRSNKQFGHLGNNAEIEAPFFCDYGYNISIGDDVEIGANCRIMDASTVEIGPRTIIGPDVKILTLDGHHARQLVGQKRPCKATKVKIGADVFIGAGAIILPGRTIEAGATIGAGTVVNRDIKGPYTFVNQLDERKVTSNWAYSQHQHPQHQQQQQPPQALVQHR